MPSIETVIFYSPNHNSEIEADVFANNGTVQHLYYDNLAGLGYSFTNGSPDANWGGYRIQYCSRTLLGVCQGYSDISQIYGYVEIPSTLTLPGSGVRTGACCALAMWTGVGNSSGGNYLTQGGVLWVAGGLPLPSQSNSNNMSLFVEYVTGGTLSYLSPPSWMGGVKGADINMSTSITGSCQDGNNAGDQWSETWNVGSSYKTQYVDCLEVGTINWGYSILESPTNNEYCKAGYYSGGDYLCQIPDFSYGGAALSWTANICNLTPACRVAYTGGNYLGAVYIDQTTQNTATGTIASGESSFSQTWISSKD